MDDSPRLILELSSASDVIDAVGGTSACSRLTGSSMASISGWRASGRLPPATFLIITAALEQLGKSAPPSLWGIKAVSAEQQ